jgi:hypothetical protein
MKVTFAVIDADKNKQRRCRFHDNQDIRSQVADAVANGEMLHQAETFDTFDEASD